VFDPHCPTCDARVLLTTRRLVSLDATPWGHRARLVCWCGTPVVQDVHRVGAPAAPEPVPVPSALPGVGPRPGAPSPRTRREAVSAA
jgi:hypothetical protein